MSVSCQSLFYLCSYRKQSSVTIQTPTQTLLQWLIGPKLMEFSLDSTSISHSLQIPVGLQVREVSSPFLSGKNAFQLSPVDPVGMSQSWGQGERNSMIPHTFNPLLVSRNS